MPKKMPNTMASRTTTAQFQQEAGHFESVQAMFITYVPPIFEKSAFAQKLVQKTLGEDESYEHVVEKQLERFEEVLRGMKDSLSLIVKVRRMAFHPDTEGTPHSGTSDLLEAINACVNGEWYPTRLPEFPYYLDCLLAKDCLNGKRLGYNNEYVQCISLTNYPAGTFPSVLADLQSLPVSFRWSNRFILTDMREALGQIACLLK